MVWEDHEYGLIKWKQQTQFGGHTDMSFGNPDWVKLAESFGCRGIHVTESAKLRGALEAALGADTPTILSLPIDYAENLKLSERLGQIACPI